MDESTRAREAPAHAVRAPWRGYAFIALLAAYLLLTIGLLHPSPILSLDHAARDLHLYSRWPQGYTLLHPYVIFGQRGPSLLIALPWFLWLSWRFRTARPMLLLGTSLVVLNLSVGVVKLLIGRLGPLSTPDVAAVFRGGNIYPSGHTANAVVLYGVIAMLAVHYGLRFTRTVVGVAVFLSATVGLSTVYLATHWLSDVIGGWIAGGLVLLALPTLQPYTERGYDWVVARLRQRRLVSAHVAQVLRPAGIETAERRDDARVPA